MPKTATAMASSKLLLAAVKESVADARFSQVQKLASTHDVSAFDCGSPALNQFLQRFALVNQKANSAQTYVSCEDTTNHVAGFYSLAVGSRVG